MNRHEKLKLLTDIGSGRIKLEDLKPKQLTIRVRSVKNGGTLQLINGSAVSSEAFHSELTRQKTLAGKDPLKIKVSRVTNTSI